MSSAILRRNSSKQGLQNLIRVTAQRSLEDAEELERERRQRARESLRRMSNTSEPGETSQENASKYSPNVKPSSPPPPLEEDEGFSDWTQRREKLQQWDEASQASQEEKTSGNKFPIKEKRDLILCYPETLQSSMASPSPLHRQQKEQITWTETTNGSKRMEAQRPDTVMEKREVKISYTSKVFLQQDMNHITDTACEERTSYHNTITNKSTSRTVAQAEEPAAVLEAGQCLDQVWRSQQDKESHELEDVPYRQVDLQALTGRREERRRAPEQEEEEHWTEEEEQPCLAKEEDERQRRKGDVERSRMVAAQRMKTMAVSTVDGDTMFSPTAPQVSTHKTENEEGLTSESSFVITERTESLSRSLKKSNSFQKKHSPVMLSGIDDKLEQYTHAIEETRASKQGQVDTLSPVEAVASKKNLFEAGDAWTLSPNKGICKDVEGLKVGVANLITQWVNVNPENNEKQSPFKPADVKPGDVMQKRNMWEILGDISGRSAKKTRGTSSKRYKFVVTGHGKYEKIPVDDDNQDEFANGKDLCQVDY